MSSLPPKTTRNRIAVQGKKTQCWRICPYAESDNSDRIPGSQKSIHTTTSGQMVFDIRGGHGRLGWTCLDPNCSYFLGDATTAIEIPIRTTTISGGQYYVNTTFKPAPLCSGIPFWES